MSKTTTTTTTTTTITPTEAELRLLECERAYRAARLHETVAIARRQSARAALDKARDEVHEEAEAHMESTLQ